jgi:hypothetical protein
MYDITFMGIFGVHEDPLQGKLLMPFQPKSSYLIGG